MAEAAAAAAAMRCATNICIPRRYECRVLWHVLFTRWIPEYSRWDRRSTSCTHLHIILMIRLSSLRDIQLTGTDTEQIKCITGTICIKRLNYFNFLSVWFNDAPCCAVLRRQCNLEVLWAFCAYLSTFSSEPLTMRATYHGSFRIRKFVWLKIFTYSAHRGYISKLCSIAVRCDAILTTLLRQYDNCGASVDGGASSLYINWFEPVPTGSSRFPRHVTPTLTTLTLTRVPPTVL